MCGLTQPLSVILREAIKEAHEEIRATPGSTALLRGQLAKEEYVRFLMMLWHLYDALERGLERHQDYPVLEPTYNPTVLARAPHLSADIAYLPEVPEASWKSHPIHLELTAAQPPVLTVYIARIEALADAPDPAPLLGHAYVRYLGDLSGGQIMQRAFSKAYGLAPGGPGLSFYAFKALHAATPATQGDIKRIKEWFYAGMNAGAGDDVAVKEAVMHEALRVFEYHREIFGAINLEEEDEAEEWNVV
ncbi:hypothetical protein FB451DRAFT_1525123 [Mycena latifolia]|nr:hypothetical protein FB451DRAFT_1525123 [Mycena latifolia]